MAISPPGDIIMDVLRAADPKAVAEARDKLAAMRAGGPDTPRTDFAAATHIQTASARRVEAQNPFVKFEALVLGTMLESMLPDEMGSVYGEGFSGDAWKSMLAQQLGDVMAARGGIGIAERYLSDRYLEGERVVPLAAAGARDEVTAEQQSLATALVHDLQRGVARSMTGDGESANAETKS